MAVDARGHRSVRSRESDSWLKPSIAACTALAIALCLGCSSIATEAQHSLLVGGEERTYRVFVPSTGSRQQSRPVVIVFHGGLGNASYIQRVSRMDRVAEKNGFIVVYPDGTGQKRFKQRKTWNAGICCGYSVKRDVDDVTFIAELLDDLAKQYRIDGTRVFATGMSNGGMFAYRLACELPERFTAIAPVSGTLVLRECDPDRAIGVLHVHGTEDQYVPERGGVGERSITGVSYPSVEASLAVMRKRNECSDNSVDEQLEQNATLRRYKCNAGPVHYLRIEGGGHDWALGSTGDPAENMSARIWEFFAAMPPREKAG